MRGMSVGDTVVIGFRLAFLLVLWPFRAGSSEKTTITLSINRTNLLI
jgi:hypothetical protein